MKHRSIKYGVGIFFASAVLLSLCGCSTVDARGHRIQHHVGYMKVDLGPAHVVDARATKLTISTLGAVARPTGLSIGAETAEIISLPDQCRLVVVPPDKWSIADLESFLKLTLLKGERPCFVEKQ